jgi:hypothetical protein
MKNGTVPVLGQAIEIVTSSTSTNYAFVIEVQTSPQDARMALGRLTVRQEIGKVVPERRRHERNSGHSHG